MIKTTNLRAAKKFGPGYFIREQMEVRHWTQEDLASVLGVTIKHINKILTDKQALTLDMARILGEVFNTSAQYWINLDTDYRLWLQKEKTIKEKEADLRAIIFERMPINDMIKKGWLNKFSNVRELQTTVIEFWNWKSLDFSFIDNNLLPCLTKKSEAYNQFNASYALTWYQMAMNIAKRKRIKDFNREKLIGLYDSLHEFTYENGGINRFISYLHESGVIFFILPHLQKTYLDGAAFLTESTPVLIYTGRYKRIDNFWFTVAHEIAHILYHLNQDTPFVLDNFKDSDRNKIEDEANSLAAKKLKHSEILEFLRPNLNYLSTSRIEECSNELHIHPAIIIGKLAYDELISYRNQSLYNENVLEFIDPIYKPLN